MSGVIYRVRTLFTTLAVAEAENPVLREGEFWTEKDPVTGNSTGRRKMGRGGVAWADLPFEPGVSGGGGGRVFNGFDEVVDPVPGDFVIDEDGTLYLRFDDGNSEQWVEASRPGADGEDGQDGQGATLGTATPQPLGTAAAGTASAASREDHVHAMPSAANVGAEPAGAAAAAVAAHVAASDPHPSYTTAAEAAAAAPVQSVAGRTGVVTLAKADVGLGNVDNTSDANKPISTATATALAGKENTGAAAAAVAAHEAAADPHPAYTTAAEVSSAIVGKVNTADLAAVATSGAYGDLSGLPTLGTAAAEEAADLLDRANHTGTQAAGTITGLAAVATSGAYADLSGRPNPPSLGLTLAIHYGLFTP